MLKENYLQSFVVSQLDTHNTILSPFASLLFETTDLKYSSCAKSIIYKLKKPQIPPIKGQIIQWFKNLQIEKRQQYTKIQDESLVYLLVYFNNRLQDRNLKVYIDPRIPNQYLFKQQKSKLQTKFKSRNFHTIHNQIKLNAEQQLLKNCKILALRNCHLFFTKQFLTDQTTFFQLLENISNNQIFQFGWQQMKKQDINNNPLWFSKDSFNRMGQWICSEIQKNLIKNYMKDLKYDGKVVELCIYKQELVFYYQKLNEKIKKEIWNEVFDVKKKWVGKKLSELIQIDPFKIDLDKLNAIKKAIIKLEEIYQQHKMIQLNKSNNHTQKPKIPKDKNQPIKKNKINKNLQKKIHSNIKPSKLIPNLNTIQSSTQQTSILFHQSISQKITQQSHTPTSQSQKDSDVTPSQIKQQLNSINQTQIQIIPLNSDEPNSLQIHTINSSQNNLQKACQNISKSIPQNIKIEQNTKQIQQNTKQIQSFISTENQKKIQQSNQVESMTPPTEIMQSHSTSDSVQYNSSRKKRYRKKRKYPEQLVQTLFEQLLQNNVQKLVDDISSNSNKLLQARIIVFQRIRNLVMKLYGQYTVDAKLFGSNAVGLALPTSDIDIFLTGFSLQSQQESIQCLQNISRRLKKLKWITKCQTYLKAKIPIIKLEVDPDINFLDMIDNQNQLQIIKTVRQKLDLQYKIKQIIKVDITIQAKKADYSHLGFLSTDFMKNCLSLFPALHPLVVTLKYLLSVKGLNKPFKGGISSYSLLIMTAAYIKQFSNLNKQQKNIGVIFLKLLQFYGEDFDHEHTAINLSLNQNSFYVHEFESTSLAVLDPLNHRIMTGNCYKFCEIREELKRIRNSLLDYKIMIREDLNQLSSVQIKSMMQKKKVCEKWLKRYQNKRQIQLQEIIKN